MSDIILDQEQVSDHAENYTYASFWNRVGASLVDFLIFLPVMGISFYNQFSLKSFALNALLSVTFITYKIFMEGTYGATFGKMALKMKVVDQEYQAITIEKAFIRNSLYVIGVIIGVLVSYKLFSHPEFQNATTLTDFGLLQQEMGYGLLEYLNTGYSFVILISVLFVLAENRQALHDKLANTFCINAR